MSDKTLDLLLVHCQGEIGKDITGGAPDIPGATILEKMNHMNRVDDSLRRLVSFEPRAHVAQTVNLLLPPCRPRGDGRAGNDSASRYRRRVDRGACTVRRRALTVGQS